MNLEFTTKRRSSAISLTPLIDVVFILLLFFMLASNFSQERSLSIASQSPANPAVTDTELIRASVRLEDVDTIFLDGAPFNQSDFLNTISIRLENDPDISVAISVSERVNVQSLLDLISLIKAVGVVKISMDGSSAP